MTKRQANKTKHDTANDKSELPSLSKQLLELHLKHELECFNSDRFIELCDSETEFLLKAVGEIHLNKFVSAKQIKQVIYENVVSSSIPGAIAEVAGEAADTLFTSKKHQETLLNQIISKKDFEEFIDKALELKEQRNKGIDKVIELPIYAELISGILYQAILRYIYESNLISKNIPGVSSMLKMGRNVVSKAAPKIGSGVEESVKSFIIDSLDFILDESKKFLEGSVSDEQLRDSAMELWEAIENKPMSEFQQGMDSLDLSEFIALGYDFWLKFRKTDYFISSYETIVDYFFKRYGRKNLDVLLEEFDVSKDRIIAPIKIFAPKALEAFKENGILEELLRRH
ncbi:hypothetical protein A3743_21255, partial [Oleiphilus sp. HI0072]